MVGSLSELTISKASKETSLHFIPNSRVRRVAGGLLGSRTHGLQLPKPNL